MIQIPPRQPKEETSPSKMAGTQILLWLHKDSRLLLGHTRKMFLQKWCKATFVVVETKTRQQDGNPSRPTQKGQALIPQELRDAAVHTKMA
jgi:hypothetical protein